MRGMGYTPSDESMEKLHMTPIELTQSWPENHRDDFAERAAIIEFDGKQSRTNAELMAYRQIVKEHRDLIPKTRNT